MIERKMFYVAKCDRCKREFANDYGEKKGALVWRLKYYNWQRKGKKWFCPDCQGEK